MLHVQPGEEKKRRKKKLWTTFTPHTKTHTKLSLAVRTYPNQKSWITGSIRTELKARAAAFKERDTNPDA